MASGHINDNVRYEPNESPPTLEAVGAGLQAAVIIVAPVVLTVVIVARIAGQPDSYISWGVFAALIVSGVTTVLQAVRVGRVGAGHVLIMGTSGAFIAVCVAALVKGGPATMASLIVRVIAVPVRAGGPAVAAASDIHAGRCRNGDHADRRNGHAGRIRFIDGRA